MSSQQSEYAHSAALMVKSVATLTCAIQVQNPIDLPQIAVVGSQSSGKSSVLENIVGRDLYVVLILLNASIPLLGQADSCYTAYLEELVS